MLYLIMGTSRGGEDAETTRLPSPSAPFGRWLVQALGNLVIVSLTGLSMWANKRHPTGEPSGQPFAALLVSGGVSGA